MKIALCFCLFYALAFGDETETEVYTSTNPLGLHQKKTFYSSGQTLDLYSTNKEIRNIFVPPSALDMFDFYTPDPSKHPPVYFNLYENGKNEGIYLLNNRTARKIKDGTDSVADYPFGEFDVDSVLIYMTASDGIYTYNPKSQDIDKFGNITEDFKAIDKVSNQDEIYALGADNKIYNITAKGTVKTKVDGIEYAKDFVLDFQGAIYFLGEDNKPQVLYKGSATPVKVTGLNFEVKKPILARPLWMPEMMSSDDTSEDHAVPFIIDGVAYLLMNNSAVVNPCDAKVGGLTAFSAEYGFVHFYGEKGHIYMHSVLASTPSGVLKRGPSKQRHVVAFNRDVEADYRVFKELRRKHRPDHSSATKLRHGL
ncbi:hypothetical protein MSG28_005510 [Choristoneura fumiferana]|uniref:Uncharacterized protein n=2 Tax=Choristoneura fumiferana TaxID=7141 RepID=A0ACC0L0C3_CHOFU|nr:hypothetical protein MSG28_013963 [Choristoneura fumiferana]KAI8441824.1 hypothetical protein MSG28_005510 [Choristoneura fumiferana]